jgi:replicative DNA helicase
MSAANESAAAEAWVPWSCQAEQSVLGGLLIDNDALSRIVGLVDVASFWHSTHRTIFDAIKRLISAGQPADVVTVFDALVGAGQAEAVGGLQHLNELAQCVPSTSNIVRYAEIVADKALRRVLIAAVDGVDDLVQGARSADEALDQVQARLGSVKRLKGGSDPRALGDLMAARVTFWEGLQSGDEQPGVPTGLKQLDEALGGGIKPGKVIVLAARPSVGKTSLATQILLHVGSQGAPGLMLSQEMTAGELMDRAASNLGAVRMDRLGAGRLDADDWSRIADVSDQALRLPVFIDDQPALTLLDMRAKARQVQRRGGLSLLVIDYVQLCGSAGTADRRHHQIEQISRGIKTLAKELDVCVLLLSQLNRSSEGGEPELHHLKESSALEEDSDIVVLLHPMGNEPDGSLLVLAKIAKNRGGRRGRLALSFDGKTQRWAPSVSNVSRRGAP